MLEYRLPSPSHVGEDSLSKVPPQEFGRGSSIIIQETAI